MINKILDLTIEMEWIVGGLITFILPIFSEDVRKFIINKTKLFWAWKKHIYEKTLFIVKWFLFGFHVYKSAHKIIDMLFLIRCFQIEREIKSNKVTKESINVVELFSGSNDSNIHNYVQNVRHDFSNGNSTICGFEIKTIDFFIFQNCCQKLRNVKLIKINSKVQLMHRQNN